MANKGRTSSTLKNAALTEDSKTVNNGPPTNENNHQSNIDPQVTGYNNDGDDIICCHNALIIAVSFYKVSFDPRSGCIPQKYARHCAMLRRWQSCPKVSEDCYKLMEAFPWVRSWMITLLS